MCAPPAPRRGSRGLVLSQQSKPGERICSWTPLPALPVAGAGPNAPVPERLVLQVQKQRDRVLERLHFRFQMVGHRQVPDLPGQLPEGPEKPFDPFLEKLNVQVDPERLRPLFFGKLGTDEKGPSAPPLGSRRQPGQESKPAAPGHARRFSGPWPFNPLRPLVHREGLITGLWSTAHATPTSPTPAERGVRNQTGLRPAGGKGQRGVRDRRLRTRSHVGPRAPHPDAAKSSSV